MFNICFNVKFIANKEKKTLQKITWIVILKYFSYCSDCHSVRVFNHPMTINIMKGAWISRFTIALGKINGDYEMKFCPTANKIKERGLLENKTRLFLPL